MPKIRRSRKKPPDGWELIEPTLEELEQKMREGKACLYTIICQTIMYLLLIIIMIMDVIIKMYVNKIELYFI